MGGRNATRVADGGFVPGLRTDKPVAPGRGAGQDAAVVDVLWLFYGRSPTGVEYLAAFHARLKENRAAHRRAEGMPTRRSWGAGCGTLKLQ